MTPKPLPLALTALLTVACDPVFSVCVEVTNCEDGEPIVGVRVRLPKYDDAEMYTEPDGVACYQSMGELGGNLQILVDKPGYESLETVVDPPEGPGRFDTAVCLTPE